MKNKNRYEMIEKFLFAKENEEKPERGGKCNKLLENGHEMTMKEECNNSLP